jgi:hypothetical protein
MSEHVGEKSRRKSDASRPAPAPVAVARDKVADNGRDHSVADAGGKKGRPVANGLPGAADALADLVGGAAKQGKSGGFVHGADDLTRTDSGKQTNAQALVNRTSKSTSADVRQRPPASNESRLIDRLDIAMRQAGVNGPALAEALGVSPQSLTNKRRKATNAGMRPELLAQASMFLACDLHWLCTGEGGDYVPSQTMSARLTRSFFVLRAMLDPEQSWRLDVMFHRMIDGEPWPTFHPPAAAAPRRPGK